MRPVAVLAAALLLLCGAGWAQAQSKASMSLQEASYRASKARLQARYQQELAACNRLGTAQARTVCARGAAMQRDANRKALKSELAPTALAVFVTHLAAAASAVPPEAAKLPARAQPIPTQVPAPAARAAVQARAEHGDAAAPQLALAVKPAEAPRHAAAVPAEAHAVQAETVPVASSYTLAFKASYGGN